MSQADLVGVGEQDGGCKQTGFLKEGNSGHLADAVERIVSGIRIIAVDIGASENGGNAGADDHRGILDQSALTNDDTGDVGNRIEGARLEFTDYDAEVTQSRFGELWIGHRGMINQKSCNG